MKSRFSLIVLSLVFSIVLALPAQAATYQLDPQHTSIVFKVKHVDVGYVYGMFLEKSGTVKYDPEKPEKTEVDLTIKTESIFTGVKKRDNHLRSSDFFNAKQHPEITFTSKKVERVGPDKLSVTGDLTMHGVTKTKTIDLKLTGSGKGPQGNFRRGFHSTFTVNRMDFGVDYMPDGLSKEIEVIFSGEVIKE